MSWGSWLIIFECLGLWILAAACFSHAVDEDLHTIPVPLSAELGFCYWKKNCSICRLLLLSGEIPLAGVSVRRPEASYSGCLDFWVSNLRPVVLSTHNFSSRPWELQILSTSENLAQGDSVWTVEISGQFWKVWPWCLGPWRQDSRFTTPPPPFMELLPPYLQGVSTGGVPPHTQSALVIWLQLFWQKWGQWLKERGLVGVLPVFLWWWERAAWAMVSVETI